MAYENRNTAYDLSLFDDDISYATGSALPKQNDEDLHKKAIKKKAKSKSKILKIPDKALQKNRLRKRNPLKIALGTVGGALIAFVIGIIIVGQVQLTELNQQIITSRDILANTQSVYTQNQMKVESSLSNSEIEQYAEDVLGMTKATNTQKEFITLSGGDKAEVSAKEGENIFTQFIEAIQNLWS